FIVSIFISSLLRNLLFMIAHPFLNVKTSKSDRKRNQAPPAFPRQKKSEKKRLCILLAERFLNLSENSLQSPGRLFVYSPDPGLQGLRLLPSVFPEGLRDPACRIHQRLHRQIPRHPF